MPRQRGFFAWSFGHGTMDAHVCLAHELPRKRNHLYTMCEARGNRLTNACARRSPVGSLAAGLTRSVVDEGQEYLECAVDADIFPSKYCTLTSQYP